MKKPDESIFKDREKEARFWEEHFEEVWKEGKPVTVKFAKNLSQGITIRFDKKTLEELRTVASKKGVGPTTLARMWILEHLQQGV
jgi:predicted DNA binding CopG/RHH family protein